MVPTQGWIHKEFIEFTKHSIKNKRRKTFDFLDNPRPVDKAIYIYIKM